MSKHLLEDMVKVKPINKEFKKEKIWEPRKKVEVKEMREIIETNHPKNRSRYMLWFVALVSVVFLFFALSFLFGKAEVNITPKTQDVVLSNESLSAVKDSSSDALSFDLVVINGDENKTIQANGEKDVSSNATGTVVIYNAFSSSPQALNIDTRLEGSNGKIYKTLTKITVPGMSKSGVPGSIEVKIYGSVAGVEYNSVPLDFKIFGFKGTPKYSKIYGRSKGGITGGFVGKAPDVSDADKTNAINELKTNLQTKLLKNATNQTPNGFILFKDATFLSIDDSSIVSAYNTDNSMTLSLKGTLYGLLFNEQKLIQKIAEDKVDKYDGSDVYISNIRDLTFTLANKDNITFDNLQNINFNLSGPAKFVWRLDTDKFTTDLLGKSKNDFNKVLTQYPNINSATLMLSPVWRISIPDKIKDIKVIVNYPK
jgi:hypothetical protein